MKSLAPVAVCGGCSNRVKTTCMGLCPKCFDSQLRLQTSLEKTAAGQPDYKAELFAVHVKYEALVSRYMRLWTGVHRAMKAKGNKKQLIARIERVMNKEGVILLGPTGTIRQWPE